MESIFIMDSCMFLGTLLKIHYVMAIQKLSMRFLYNVIMGPTMLLKTTCAPLNHCFILKIFIEVF